MTGGSGSFGKPWPDGPPPSSVLSGRQHIGYGASEPGQIVAAVHHIAVGKNQRRRVGGVDGDGTGQVVNDPDRFAAGVQVFGNFLRDFGG